MMNVAYTLGRIFVPIVFIVAGIQKLLNVSSVARMIENSRIPVPDAITPYLAGVPKYQALGYLVGAIELICGLMILIGLKARWGALVLAVFTASTIILFHNFWEMEGAAAAMNQTEALKNLSILGGLLLLVAGGSGSSSYDRRA